MPHSAIWFAVGQIGLAKPAIPITRRVTDRDCIAHTFSEGGLFQHDGTRVMRLLSVIAVTRKARRTGSGFAIGCLNIWVEAGSKDYI